jgi:hypothetical protein
VTSSSSESNLNSIPLTLPPDVGNSGDFHLTMNSELAPESTSTTRSTSQRLRPELISGSALALFLVSKTIEIHLQKNFSWSGLALTQVLEYFLIATFAIFLCRSFSRKSTVQDPADLSDPRPLPEEAQDVSPQPEEAASQIASPQLPEVWDIDFIEVHEIESLVETIMAYSRYYKDVMDRQSQQWKDLLEIREQAIRVQEMMNRADPSNSSDLPSTQVPDIGREKKRFRRTPRTLELVPVTVRGTAPNEEPFHTSSYTMNISPRGACLFLPDRGIQVGQKIHIQNHHFATEAQVHWATTGRADNTMFAGVEFLRPIDIS